MQMKEGIYIGRDSEVATSNSTRHFGIHYAKLRLAVSGWLCMKFSWIKFSWMPEKPQNPRKF